MDPLDHRRLLDAPASFRPFQDSDLFARIGGQQTVDALVDRLYDAFEDDPMLRPLFPRDLSEPRAGQKVFFADWLGGKRTYTERTHSPLRHRHDDVSITRAHAGRWLAQFRAALAQEITDEADRKVIFEQAKPLAHALVNATDRPGTSVAACGVGARTMTGAATLARRGDVDGLDAALTRAPDLVRASYGARLLHDAAIAGKPESVRLLLERGVGPDAPHFLPVGIVGHSFERVVLVTPLCAARFRRRAGVETVLQEAGARDDVFTAAFLGALELLESADAALARACDPATDVLDITPVDHAVAGGQVDALTLLLDRHGVAGTRALAGAAEKNSVEMAQLLLDHGADAVRIGPGRWVLHPQLAPLLAAHGATAGSGGAWIGLACTGNQGRKDDPEYVRALLRHGARADDRRTGASGVAALGATGLHFAAKAGFVETVKVLLEHGADPAVTDNRGRTPLDWLDESTPNAARTEVRHVLLGSIHG